MVVHLRNKKRDQLKERERETSSAVTFGACDSRNEKSVEHKERKRARKRNRDSVKSLAEAGEKMHMEGNKSLETHRTREDDDAAAPDVKPDFPRLLFVSAGDNL